MPDVKPIPIEKIFEDNAGHPLKKPLDKIRPEYQFKTLSGTLKP